MPADLKPTVLHYTGAENDRGGIVSVIRALATSDRCVSLMGVSSGGGQRRLPPLPTLELPRLDPEVLGLRTAWRALAVAREVRRWLAVDPGRVFHAHSRAGLLVACLLAAAGEARIVVSIHCYGRQRWFYRRAAWLLGSRLFWLSPAMKRHYGLGGGDWSQCIPECVTPRAAVAESRPGPDGNLRLGGIGLLVAWKRWHDVIAALAALPAGVRERVTFRHIGSADTSGPSRRYAEDLRARTAALGLSDRVSWLGEQPDSEAFLRTVDAVVVASQGEPFSLGLLEALRAGVPAVAADSGGAVDVLQEGESGWLFRTGDAGDLAGVIASLVTTDAVARVRITPETIRPFTVPVIAAQWAAVYAGLKPASR